MILGIKTVVEARCDGVFVCSAIVPEIPLDERREIEAFAAEFWITLPPRAVPDPPVLSVPPSGCPYQT